MLCPFCKHPDSKVIDSRSTLDGASIRRRRECLKCNKRFTTYETIEYAPLMVIKKDGSRQPFSREKILRGLMKACEKRPVSRAQMDALITDIEQQFTGSLEAEIPTERIGEMVMERLSGVDEVAYIRFVSVYRDFQDISSFMDELQKLQQKE